ncbi:hypothetical protein [Winogradskyella psychrotolerans]|uniref:hypothetical protein n=1 Tax=Winogradskyella psychrotolerans TaxID=1344585 RepID=UPI001C07B5AC|nr:hypothetical protein [Winogradskyella psychrotolerans]MBU2930250.1 hypothetical protein [Winogradskyella psychrotolerans]
MRKIAIILMTLFTICSCSTNDNNTTENENFYALTEGNSWAYKYYNKDLATGEFVATTITETVNITHTTEIDGNTYYNFKHIVTGNNGNIAFPNNGEQNYMLRDSLGFLINEIGGIKYANNNYEEHFVDRFDDISSTSIKLQLSTTQDIVSIASLGDFICLDNNYFLRDVNGNQLNGLDHVYREDGTGEILSTLSFASESDHYGEKRLESYIIQ